MWPHHRDVRREKFGVGFHDEARADNIRKVLIELVAAIRMRDRAPEKWHEFLAFISPNFNGKVGCSALRLLALLDGLGKRSATWGRSTGSGSTAARARLHLRISAAAFQGDGDPGSGVPRCSTDGCAHRARHCVLRHGQRLLVHPYASTCRCCSSSGTSS